MAATVEFESLMFFFLFLSIFNAERVFGVEYILGRRYSMSTLYLELLLSLGEQWESILCQKYNEIFLYCRLTGLYLMLK